MYFSLIITFLLVLVVVIASIQNSMVLEIKFMTWNLQLSLSAIIFYFSLVGAAIVAVLTLPKLLMKSFRVRKLKKEIYELKRNSIDIEQQQKEGSGSGPG